MIEIIGVDDSRAVRNKNNVLALYDLMISKKKSKSHGQIREPGIHPAQPVESQTVGRAGNVLRPDYTGTRPGPRRRPPHHRRRRLCMGARELSESLQ